MLAKVIIPVGATCIRAGFPMNNQVRTDQMIIQSVEDEKGNPVQLKSRKWVAYPNPNIETCRCFSEYDPTYEYQYDKMKPRKALSQNLKFECESGLHFFLKKEDAKNYLKASKPRFPSSWDSWV